jgi:hypothetical protein
MGIIQNQMAPPAAPPVDPSAPPVDPASQASPPEPDDEGAGEEDPGYQQALKFAMDALYKGGAAKQIAQQIKSSKGMATTVADIAYNIITIADEKTQGAVPDELLAMFASSILKEVVDIAEAAGIKVKPAEIAAAMKTMILRYLGEQGIDTTQMQAAMDQVDPSMFDQADTEEQVE